ncbi:MAG: peptidase M23, partial [Roseobacter sp.]|nr:peptidase M23 [Roseobacter sp.]
MKYAFAFLVIWLTVSSALATPADEAREAMALLDTATQQLEAAQSSRDRVRALTATISAYEAGLSALRSGLRQAAVRQAELSEALQVHDGEIAALLAALQRVGGTGSPVVLLHPAGPVGTARAGMLVAELAPALDAKAADLRQDLAELEELQNVQKDALERLEAGLLEVHRARTALNQAIANRSDLPKRFILDPVNEAVLVASAQTLSEFAMGLDLMIAEDVVEASFDIAAEKGSLPAPVVGKVLRRAGERDAAGVARPGLILATAPRAIVTSPVPA